MQTLREHGENLRRQQRLEACIDRMASEEKAAGKFVGKPVRRRPLYLYYTLGGVAACLALFFIFSRWYAEPMNPQPGSEVAQVQARENEQIQNEVFELEAEPKGNPVRMRTDEAVQLLTNDAVVARTNEAMQLRTDEEVVARTSEIVRMRESERAVNQIFEIEKEVRQTATLTQDLVQVPAQDSVQTSAQDPVQVPTSDIVQTHPQVSSQTPTSSQAATDTPTVIQGEIHTIHTLVSYSPSATNRKVRLLDRCLTETKRAHPSKHSLLTFNL